VRRRLAAAFGLSLLAGCGQVDPVPFVPNLSGNYSFLMQYSGGCTTVERPGRCSVDPVVLLQSETNIVIQPLGAGKVDQLIVVFASDKLDLCDLSQATLTFNGLYDGQNISGQVNGTMQRSGFEGSCSIQGGTFSLNRTP
jgi:hypothetical protein